MSCSGMRATLNSVAAAGFSSRKSLLTTGRMSFAGQPISQGSATQPSTPSTVVMSSYFFCSSGSAGKGVPIHTTSLPGFSRPTVQFGVQV